METDAPTADHAWLAPADYPPGARDLHAQGACIVDVAVDSEGNPTGVVRKDCNDVFFEAALDAAMRSRFSPGGLRTFTVQYPFSVDSGLRHDWRVSLLGSAYGLCAHCRDGGLLTEDSALLGFGRAYDGFLVSAYAGSRDGGLEVGAGVAARVFWQHAFSPTASLRSALVFAEGDTPMYHSLVATGGLSVRPPGQRWGVEAHGGVDLRLGWRYYRAMRPDLGVALSWDFPPPGTTARLRTANTPTTLSVAAPPIPIPPPAAPTPADPREVPLGDLTLLSAVAPVFPDEARRLGLVGDCSVRVSLTADGIPDDVQPADCPAVFFESAAEAARATRFAPFIGPVSGGPAPVSVLMTYEFEGLHGALRRAEPTPAGVVLVAPAVERQARELRACVDSALTRDPSMTGELSMGWRVVSGVVVDVQVVANTTGDKALGACFATGIQALRFEPSVTTEVPVYTWTVPGQ